MTNARNEDVNILIKDAILESDSPVPTLLDVARLTPKDYIPLSEKNLGQIKQIGVYPPGKDLHSSCFWYLCLHNVEKDLTFPKMEGYDCTTVVLPKKGGTNPVVKLQQKEDEAPTAVKPLFPHSWSGDNTTHCVVANAPVTNLQFMIKRDRGKAQFRVDKLDKSVSSESSDDSRRLVLSSFALVYVVEGHVKIVLDENHSNSHSITLAAGETLYVQRDDDASPTSMVMQACDSQGSVSHHDFDATMVTLQITEIERPAPIKSKLQSPEIGDITVEPPHPRQRRSSSLVVYDTTAEKDISLVHPADADVHRRDSLSSIYPGDIDARQIYQPPKIDSLEVPEPMERDKLSIEDYPKGKISTARIRMMKQGLSEWICLPVIVCRGEQDGPVVGITAAVHGNELNGVPCIHKVAADIDITKLMGTVVAVPCVNVVGYLQFQRGFADGRDLNRNFPGSEDGYASQVFCYKLMDKIISQFNYLIDLHTASFGRVNSYYVRADMNDEMSASMAKLQQPQIILHNSGQDGTLRSAASARGINAITVEIGNPQLFQDQLVQWTYVGVMRILDHLKMLPMEANPCDGPPGTILCSKGFWIYTKTGGVLEVYPAVNSVIKKDDLIACIKDLFGHVVVEYRAPCAGIVIGRSSNPVAMTGDRILHLGVIKKKGEKLSKAAKENY